MSCSSNCKTGPHATYGACLRAKGVQVAGVEAHAQNQAQNKQINEYVKARYAGLQPRTVFKHDVDYAWKQTDRTGTPYRADK